MRSQYSVIVEMHTMYELAMNSMKTLDDTCDNRNMVNRLVMEIQCVPRFSYQTSHVRVVVFLTETSVILC